MPPNPVSLGGTELHDVTLLRADERDAPRPTPPRSTIGDPRSCRKLIESLPAGPPSIDCHSRRIRGAVRDVPEQIFSTPPCPRPPAELSPDTAPNGRVIDGLDPAGNNRIALCRSPSSQARCSPTRMGSVTPQSVTGASGDLLHVRLRSGGTGWATARFVPCER